MHIKIIFANNINRYKLSHITWGRTWFRRGYGVSGKRVEGTCGPALKNYGAKYKRKRR